MLHSTLASELREACFQAINAAPAMQDKSLGQSFVWDGALASELHQDYQTFARRRSVAGKSELWPEAIFLLPNSRQA